MKISLPLLGPRTALGEKWCALQRRSPKELLSQSLVLLLVKFTRYPIEPPTPPVSPHHPPSFIRI
jgi:hypothetical protein